MEEKRYREYEKEGGRNRERKRGGIFDMKKGRSGITRDLYH